MQVLRASLSCEGGAELFLKFFFYGRVYEWDLGPSKPFLCSYVTASTRATGTFPLHRNPKLELRPGAAAATGGGGGL